MCAIAQSRMQGQGGFGSVFEAQWRGKPVAVKVPVYSIVSYMPVYIVHCIRSVGNPGVALCRHCPITR